MEELHLQLNQMRQALSVADPKDKPGLQSIICQLEELIDLSSETYSAHSVQESVSPVPSIANDTRRDSLSPNHTSSSADDEFRKFKDEIAALEMAEKGGLEDTNESAPNIFTTSNTEGSNASEDSLNSIIREVSALEGTKCQAPHQVNWGQLGYYNAIILAVEVCKPPSEEEKDEQKDFSMDSILVRVAFTQPVVDSMLPCPYYQESRCRFADTECKYSHGEIVSLSSLRDYKEPNFSQIVPGSRVLAKHTNSLWYPGTVLSLIDEDGQICEIEYDDNKETAQIPLHDATPLESYEENSSSSSDSDIDYDNDVPEIEKCEHPSNFKVFGKEAFGDWEKYTLGMGSKLMAKMGYIQGGGLGKNGEGRLEPVEVTVYPTGLSLDTCIEIREASGRRAITVEEKLKRQSKQMEKNYIRKRSGRKTVFDFLNANLKTKTSGSSGSDFSISKTSKNIVQINKASCSTLSKSLLSVGENIIQIKKKISKLKEGLQRQSSNESAVANNLKEKIKCAERELNVMEKQEGTLLNERKNRHEKKKLSVF